MEAFLRDFFRMPPAASMGFEDALKKIPEEWTAFELQSRRRKTKFVFTLSKLPEGDMAPAVESAPGYGSTPTEAVLDAIKKLGAA